MIRPIRADNPGPFTLDGTMTWIIGDHTVIDPGPIDPRHIEKILEAAPALRDIFVTHRHADHAPAAIPLAKQSGAKIHAHPDVFDREVGIEALVDRASFDLDGVSLTALHTPGHTYEHFCFITGEGELFSGDTILGEGTTAIFPPDGEMKSYLKSLRLLRSLEPASILPGHGPRRDDAVAWIDHYISHRLERENQILAALQGSPGSSIPALRSVIYPELGLQLHTAAETQLLAHLIHLHGDGRVSTDGPTWSATGR